MRQNVFDMFENDELHGSSNDKLFPFIDHENEKECLDWLEKDIYEKIESRRSRLEVLRRLDALYKGASYRFDSTRHSDRVLVEEGFKQPKVFTNFVNEMVEAKVAQRARFKPAIAVLPQSDEVQDEWNAELAKFTLTAKSQEMDFETVFAAGDKSNFLRGESYTYVRWNKELGEIHPSFAKLTEESIELKDDDGNVVPAVTTGDIEIKVLGPDRAFYELRKSSWNEVNTVSVIDWVHQDELKSLYPEIEDKIHPSSKDYFMDWTDQESRGMNRHCMVVEFYHKPTKFMPNGAYVKYIPGCILEINTEKYPYDHKKLPVIFDTDIDVDGEITGRPFTANIERLQRLHDMVTASMAKGYAIASSPKLVYPKGAIDPNQFTNGYAAIEYAGPVAPQLVTYNGIPNASLDFRAVLELVFYMI